VSAVEHYDIEWLQEQIYHLQTQVRELEMKLDRITYVPPVFPTTPLRSTSSTCTKCGMRWEGTMVYFCPQSDCPIQKKVTSQI
jgi:hypothetical protein